MAYLNAVIKVTGVPLVCTAFIHLDHPHPTQEGLRFHPAIPRIERMASQDDVLPLSKPVLTNYGDMIDEVLIPKGTIITASVAAYNR